MSSGTFVTVIRVLSSMSAMYMCLSPTPTILKIRKTKSTGPVNVVPLAALWACNHLWMIYGYVTNDVFPLLVTYAVGDALSIIFLSVYYYWSTEKKHVLKVCASILAVNILVTTYAVLGYNLQEHSIVIRVVGIIAIGSSIFFYASPLTTIKKVLQTKNAASIPFGMVVVGTINNTLWIIYGFLINDILLITPTIVNGTLGAIQLVLYVIYRPSGKDTHNLPDVIPQKVEKDIENPSTTSISGNTEPEMKEMKEITIDAVELQSPKFIELRSPSHIELKV